MGYTTSTNWRCFYGGFPCSSVGKESACKFTRPRLDPWVGKIPWRRKWQPIPVSLTEKSHGQCWSFNGPEPGGLESTIRKLRERKRLMSPGLRGKPRALFLGLALLHVGTRHPLEWVKAQCAFSRGSQKPGQESELSGPLSPKELAENREREKERHGDQSSDGAKVF